MTDITNEQLLRVQEAYFKALQSQESSFEQIKASGAPILERWQQLVSLLIPPALAVIKALGYKSDQAGLMSYNKLLMDRMQNDDELKAIHTQKWAYLYEHAFGVVSSQSMSLSEAQKIVKDIADRMSSEPFLNLVEQTLKQLPSDAEIPEKRQALLNLILPLHQEVIVDHGYKGDIGYIEFQKALTDHYHDEVLIKESQRSQESVFSRASHID